MVLYFLADFSPPDDAREWLNWYFAPHSIGGGFKITSANSCGDASIASADEDL